jgi:hypothetical protein
VSLGLLALRWYPRKNLSLMNVTIEFSDEKAAALTAQAQARGLAVERWLEKVSTTQLYCSSPEEDQSKEWVRQFDAWMDSHDPNTPVLSEESMSRESILRRQDLGRAC